MMDTVFWQSVIAADAEVPAGHSVEELTPAMRALELPSKARRRPLATILDTPRGPVTIRPTHEVDAVDYRELRLFALQEHPEAFGMDYVTSAAQPIEHWQERMRNGAGGEHGVTYVAEAAGGLVGMTVLVRNDLPKTSHAGNIYSVYTHPDWRGLGVADALLAACVEYARDLGLRLIRLAVVTTNASAIRLYLRHGFTVYGVEGEAIFANGNYYDELLMERKLWAS
jgi:ribosomal protein S18 acetylase RimI-like enzyme